MIMVVQHKGTPKKRDTLQNFRANVDVYFGLMTKILNFRVIPLYENTHQA